jgi:membrane protein DedA with SNARE-associated domain
VESLSASLVAFVSDQDNLAGLSILAAAALVEYVFPPFPGDTITLLGAVLITARGWSAPLVLGAVITGALLGTALDWAVGRRLARSGRIPPRWRERLDRMAARFDKRGAAYLFVARFLPGMRALSCVAAGVAGMSLASTLLWSGLASLLYNVGLIALGSLLGANLDELQVLMAKYTQVVWTVVGAGAALALGVVLWRRVHRRRARPR